MQNSIVGQTQIPQQYAPQYTAIQNNAPAQQPVQQTEQATQQPVQQYVAPQAVQQPVMPQAPQVQEQAIPNYSGVNIQIFNPSVTPPGATPPVYNVNAPTYQTNPQGGMQSYPANYYTKQFAPNPTVGNSQQNITNTTNNIDNSKKTEKREIVELTDEYIKNLENYLNSQDKELRYMGAKEVVARLQEDDSRKDDAALNALIDKMLQDPYQKVRFLAMAALQNRMATGDQLTAQLLTNIQQSPDGYGQDSLMASDILLKMSGQTTEKEFEVKDKPSNKK